MPRPVGAWAIVKEDGDYEFMRSGLPELFKTRDFAESQNINRLNGARVVRVQILSIKPKRK